MKHLFTMPVLNDSTTQMPSRQKPYGRNTFCPCGRNTFLPMWQKYLSPQNGQLFSCQYKHSCFTCDARSNWLPSPYPPQPFSHFIHTNTPGEIKLARMSASCIRTGRALRATWLGNSLKPVMQYAQTAVTAHNWI